MSWHYFPDCRQKDLSALTLVLSVVDGCNALIPFILVTPCCDSLCLLNDANSPKSDFTVEVISEIQVGYGADRTNLGYMVVMLPLD